MIAGDFPLVPIRTIQQLLAENNYHLFPTFTAVDNATTRVDRASLSWKYKKTPSVQPGKYKAENIDASIESYSIDWEKELMKELQAARLVRSDAAEKDRVKTLAEETERRNFEAAEARGELVECGCCFADVAPNRLVYCNGDVIHVSIFYPSHYNCDMLRTTSSLLTTNHVYSLSALIAVVEMLKHKSASRNMDWSAYPQMVAKPASHTVSERSSWIRT